MSPAKRFDRARRHMDEELREEPMPEPRWDDMERALLARIEESEREGSPAPRLSLVGAGVGVGVGPMRPSRPAWMRAATLAAAAAVIALGVGVGARALRPGAPDASGASGALAEAATRVVDLAALPLVPGSSAEPARDLRALRPGDVIEATAGAVTLSHPGAVRWTLAPGGRALVRAQSEPGARVRHVIALERGSLRVEVTPGHVSAGLVELFAVDVDRTRVAVHGTLFTVTRSGDRVEVEVERGVVSVGLAEDGAELSAHRLVAPARGTFTLDGGLLAPMHPPREPTALAEAPAPAQPPRGAPEPATPSSPSSPSTPSSPAPAAPTHVTAPSQTSAPANPSPPSEPAAPAAPPPDLASPPAAPATASPPLTIASVQAGLARCFAEKRAAGFSAVQASITSILRVAVREDGSVSTVRFDPPLKPELQTCAQLLYVGRFAEGPQDLALPIRIAE